MAESDNAPADSLAAQDAKLAEWEKQQSAELAAAKPADDNGKPAGNAPPAGDRAPAAKPPDKAPPISEKKTDTPSEAEAKKKQEQEAKDKADLEAAEKAAESEGKEIVKDDKGAPKRDEKGQFVKQDKPKDLRSKYAKDLDKKLLRWDAIQTREAELKKREETVQKAVTDGIAAERKKFDAEVQAFRDEQAQANQANDPAWYDKAAVSENQKAEKLEALAKQAEADGEFDKAEKLRDQAKFARNLVNVAKARAEQLRANPPADAKARQETFLKHQREWIGKAAVDFPEFAKKDSELQKAAFEFHKQMTTETPQLAKFPGIIYYCVERASLKSAADRVPGLEKELGELKTEVARLNELTNPTGPGGVARQPAVKDFSQKSSEEQFEQLKQEAASLNR